MSMQHAIEPFWTYIPDHDMVGAPTTWHDDEGTYTDLRYPRVIAHLPDDWDQVRHGHLIAAAPDLRKALYELRNECSGKPRPHMLRMLLKAADEALAKAEGGT